MNVQQKIQRAKELNKDVTTLLQMLDNRPNEALEEWVYEETFRKGLKQEIDQIITFDWYDPDTSYAEDARAYLSAAQEHLMLLIDFDPLDSQ